MEQYADLVKIHYQYHKNPRNYKKYIPAGYVELDGYTDNDSIAFKKGDEIVIAMRGLNPTQLRDLRIGAEIIAGDVMNPRGFDFDTSRGKYKQILDNEQEKYEKIKQQYPDAKIVFAGHSRGGRKAIDMGKHNDVEYKAFNPGDATSLRDYVYSVGIPIAMAQMPLPFLEGSEYVGQILTAGMRAGLSDTPYMTGAGSMIQSGSSSKFIRTQMAMGGENPFQNIREAEMLQGGREMAAKQTRGLIAHLVNAGQIPPEAYEDALRMQQDAVGNQGYMSGDIARAAALGFETAQLPLLPTQRENNENIFVTERDIVSHGYKGGKMADYFGGRPTIVEPKEYVKSMDITHHSIDHFTSKEILDRIANDEKIRVLNDDGMSIPSRFEREEADNFSPRSLGSSGAMKTRPLNVEQLCAAYPELPECAYLRSMK
tara:strand:- start:1176 stop:2459 length:1284 start_codon:yes stop_codon:yes gene_type:complete